MPVLRVFGRKKVQRARAAKELQARRADYRQEVRVSEDEDAGKGQGTPHPGNGREELNMTHTTRAAGAASYTRLLEVESEWIGTRRYFSNLPYTLPKDAPEADRLNFQHYYLRRLFKGLYLAPLEKRLLRSVLDVGCGTGRWACEMALDFPHTQVVGLDIELPRPGALIKPPNLAFTAGNVLARLPFKDHSFSYVYQRMLAAAIPTIQWPTVVAELVRVTCPGGWIELIEAGENYLNIGPALTQFLHWSRSINGERGIDSARVAYLDDLLMGAGLSRVEKRVLRVPVGSWGGRMGSTLAQNILAAFEGMRGIYCQKIPIYPEQFDATLAILPGEWNTYRTEFAIFAAYGQVREDL